MSNTNYEYDSNENRKVLLIFRYFEVHDESDTVLDGKCTYAIYYSKNRLREPELSMLRPAYRTDARPWTWTPERELRSFNSTGCSVT